MTPDAISGMSVVAIVTIAVCILTPILTWVLPDRGISSPVVVPKIDGASIPEA